MFCMENLEYTFFLISISESQYLWELIPDFLNLSHLAIWKFYFFSVKMLKMFAMTIHEYQLTCTTSHQLEQQFKMSQCIDV